MNETDWSGEWFRFAEMDLASAEYLVNMRPVPTEIICFHCQQSAEKALKGVLVSYDMEPPKTHDLEELCRLCGQFDEAYGQLREWCHFLSPYGVQARYPRNPEIPEVHMRRALAECRNLYTFIRERRNGGEHGTEI